MSRFIYAFTLGLLLLVSAVASAQPFFIIDAVEEEPDDFDPMNDPEDYILLNTPLSVGPTSVSYFLYDYDFASLCLMFTTEEKIGFVEITEPFMNLVFGGIDFDPSGTKFTLEPSFPGQELTPGQYFSVIHSTEFELEAGCFVPEPTSSALWLTAVTALLLLRHPSHRRRVRCRSRPTGSE